MPTYKRRSSGLTKSQEKYIEKRVEQGVLRMSMVNFFEAAEMYARLNKDRNLMRAIKLIRPKFGV